MLEEGQTHFKAGTLISHVPCTKDSTVMEPLYFSGFGVFGITAFKEPVESSPVVITRLLNQKAAWSQAVTSSSLSQIMI